MRQFLYWQAFLYLPYYPINRLLQRPNGCIARRTTLACLALGLSFLPASSGILAADPLLKRFEYSLPRMGTMFRIEMYAADNAQASRAAEAAFARAEELEQIMSDYRADSELMRLSREGASAPFPVSSDLYDVLAKSQWTSELSRGAFDVSIGPLVDLWRTARKTGRLPDPGEISKARVLVDYRNIELDAARHAVFLKRAGMKLDLGAIGKGYAADQMLAVLKAQGIDHAMVVAGGEVIVSEPPPGNSGWKVGIDTADADAGSPPCTLLLRAAAVSTSGDEHQFLELNGHRYSHVINPATGWALEGQSSTTVIARDSTTADSLGTALSLMPVADGIRVAESLPGVSALWVRRVGGEWKYYATRGFPTSCRDLRERGKVHRLVFLSFTSPYKAVTRLKNLFVRFKNLLLLGVGIGIGVAVILSGKAGADATSSDKYCDQSCHSHPDATQTWIRSPHYTTKSGVVTHCIDCHLPGGGIDYYTEKARLGGIDIYGKLFKDLTKINWQSMQSLNQARTFTYDSACTRCHANLFSVGLSKKGVDGHLHYQRSKDKMRCINCHLHTGHYRGKQAEEVVDEAAAQEQELEKAFPSSPQGFKSYTEVVPGSTVRIRMVAIPGGSFQMGSPESEPYRRADEGPVHTVKISPFWMERAEVTWREYEVYLLQRGNTGRNRDAPTSGKTDAVSGPTPPYGSPDQGWGRGSRPAITMTYYAATKYCEWLSQITGKKYRLPTEAEWEYAARAGVTSPYFFAGDPSSFTTQRWLNRWLGVKTAPLIDYAWYQGDSLDETHPTGLTKPNAWGLEDMLGNVREFCLDWYDPDAYAHMGDGVTDPRGPDSGKEHVVRGGSYRSDAADLRCAARDHTREDDWLLTDPQSPKSIWWYSDCTDVGFRVVREQ